MMLNGNDAGQQIGRAKMKNEKNPITIQYEISMTRRGQFTTTIKERTFVSQVALERWADKNSDNVTILRYLRTEVR